MAMFSSAKNFVISGGSFINYGNLVSNTTFESMKEIMEDEERQKILAWVSSMDFLGKHCDISDKCQPGTGKWLLNTDAFKQWQSGRGQVLWCPGMPGAGKTVLSSVVINHLRAYQLHEPVGTIGVDLSQLQRSTDSRCYFSQPDKAAGYILNQAICLSEIML